MKSAPQWRIDRAGNLSFKDNFFRSLFRIKFRSDRDESLCVWVHRILEDIFRVSILHHLSKIHNSYFLREKPCQGKIMRYKEVGKIQVLS